MEVQSVMPGEVVVASGAFAPGHLGELTQLIPFEMVDEALRETRTGQRRIRILPARVVVYLLLAGALFADLGWPQVWQRLTAGLRGVAMARPSAAALTQARRRLGAEPLQWLFDLVRGPAVGARVPGVRWRGLLLCAIDGTLMTVADSPANLTMFTKQRGNHGGSGYPQLRLLVLACCGARTVIDAVFGPATRGEVAYTQHLLPSLRAGMMVLLDRNFAVRDLIDAITATGAQVLVRVRDDRCLPVLRRCGDGSYLSMLGRLPVRVVEARITVTTATGRRTGAYRLVTSLTDAHRYPADELIGLYHQRWGATRSRTSSSELPDWRIGDVMPMA
ncbi:IS4 family transposase [Streptosporangium sp. NPDC000396]|uniref:IS4 family transposase n=1 Tax=Streptosporangium sp. NPDC000396 TaxID=3366185 RepID=UPI00369BDAFE